MTLAGRPRRGGLRAGAMLLLACLPSPARALVCSITSNSPSFLPSPASFALTCDAPVVAPVSWEFGDGATLGYATNQAAVSHAYAAIGDYTVFARVQGEPFPFTRLHTVLHPPTPRRATQSATILHDSARARVWNVNADNNSVTVADAVTLSRIQEIPVGRNPRTLALDTLGRVWVVNQDDATISIVDGGTMEVVHTVPLPYASRPYGIAFAPGGRTGYVTLEATGKLFRIDALTRQPTGSLDLFPTPRAIAVTHDGARILVTRFISPANRGEVAEVSASPFALSGIIPLAYDTRADNEDNGSGVPNALSSVTISPDGRRAWVTFKKDNVGRGLFVNPGLLAPTFESTVRTAVAKIDLATGTEDSAARIDLNNRSRAAAVAFDGNGAFAYVATLTSNHTAVLNNATGAGATSIEPSSLTAELAPDGLALGRGDSVLFVHYFMSREVAAYDLSGMGSTNELTRLAVIPAVVKERLPPQVLRGKQVFYNAADPRMARDRYISCAVCHLDGATDGRVWDFTHKGEGLRRTTSLLGRGGMAHGPVHWSANFDEIQDFEHDIRDAFGGNGLMRNEDYNAGTRNTPLGAPKAGLSADLDALAAYVASLTRVNSSPFRNPDGSMTAAALAGEAIFNSAEARCAQCHVPPKYTDSRLDPDDFTHGIAASPGGFLLHDVGTLKPGSGKRLNDTLKGLDTPTLLGVWETGPYLHDGSAPTLMDVLTTANAGDKHGKTSHLTQQDRENLVAFLLQLDQSHEPASVRKPPRASTPGAAPPSILKSAGGYLIYWDPSAAGENVTLRIFDSNGRLLATLRPQSSPGTRTKFYWDAGSRLGVHHLRLSWEGGSRSQRVLLTR